MENRLIKLEEDNEDIVSAIKELSKMVASLKKDINFVAGIFKAQQKKNEDEIGNIHDDLNKLEEESRRFAMQIEKNSSVGEDISASYIERLISDDALERSNKVIEEVEKIMQKYISQINYKKAR
ncbi:hypothetical protein KDE13_09160 [Campylobacter sp. faydin G-140]|uniref:hypothetical protein n=1 Tax=Campylobacter anatolicus TaxID=2829105 RepID=UPI001B8F7F60|nr:hypothetical protein [Campylobacter anatolicus]MBR8466501.1 hypothetical protein [Campylobacter anatolicus]